MKIYVVSACDWYISSEPIIGFFDSEDLAEECIANMDYPDGYGWTSYELNTIIPQDEPDDIPDDVDETNYDPYCGCDMYEICGSIDEGW